MFAYDSVQKVAFPINLPPSCTFLKLTSLTSSEADSYET